LPHIKSLVDKHRGNGKQSTELFNSVVSDLLESDKTLSLKTYEHVTGLLSNAKFLPLGTSSCNFFSKVISFLIDFDNCRFTTIS
jgi:hypothetical protein